MFSYLCWKALKIVNKLLKATIDKCGSTNSVMLFFVILFFESNSKIFIIKSSGNANFSSLNFLLTSFKVSIKKGDLIAVVEGNIKNILIGERVALNFLSHISGIATKTNKFAKLTDKKCKICCTRKTIPNLRVIQKYAVKLGGGTNHRFNLSDEFLIKDNHIASSDLRELVSLAIKNKKGKKITVELDN